MNEGEVNELEPVRPPGPRAAQGLQFSLFGFPTRIDASFLLIVASAVLPVVNPGVAGAQTSCDLGFALTRGGLAEADLNGDGLTCEFKAKS